MTSRLDLRGWSAHAPEERFAFEVRRRVAADVREASAAAR